MRFVIFGAGAIGGVVGARLHQSGHPVTLIARGPHLEAIRRDGLTLLTPVERSVLPLPAVAAPGELRWAQDDVVLLATKGQDTAEALSALRAARADIPVVCLQNGVENERQALRFTGSVYGAVVMAPTAHLEPGVVEAYGSKLTGMIDVGCYPAGVDDRCREVCAALAGATFTSRPRHDVMRAKHAKLINNLGNAVEALVGPSAESDALTAAIREEGRAVLTAAGIAHEDEEVADVLGRWEQFGVRDIAGRARAGSSTRQSLMRGTALETDYLNGEIVLQGRLHGIPTPLNAAICRLAARAARENLPPGSYAAQDLLAVAA